MSTETTISPVLEDDSGYRVRTSDTEFLGLDQESLRRISVGECPLGLDAPSYREFVRTLFRALEREGVEDADVRIQGSSVKFFSGGHKKMPFDRTELSTVYRQSRGHVPSGLELDKYEISMAQQWPINEKRPLRRMFDVLYTLGLARQPSDYDVQISSDNLIDIIIQELNWLGIESNPLTLNHPTYDFIKKDLIDDILLYLSAWIDKTIRWVGRPVSVALFPSGGPAKCSDISISSHFKKDDWIVHNQVTEIK